MPCVQPRGAVGGSSKAAGIAEGPSAPTAARQKRMPPDESERHLVGNDGARPSAGVDRRRSSAYVDVMDQSDAHAVIKQFLAQAGGDALRELGLTLSLQKQLDVLQLQAVRNAALAHSWSEIGSALGVTKQAAHRKFVHLLAEDVKTQKRALKQAQRAGQPAEAGAALTAALEGVEVLKKVGRRP